jgi:uncharacterized membrane protein YedE/YeeE
MQTFANAALGGVLIGFAATLLLLLNGRLAGLSGILKGVIFPVAQKGELLWRLLFLLGLISGAAIPGPAIAMAASPNREFWIFFPALIQPFVVRMSADF